MHSSLVTMHHGQLHPKNVSFQCLLKMSVVHILPQI